MISLLLLFIAGIFDAARDLISFRYAQSIFYKLNPYFWDPERSWKNKYRMPFEKGEPLWYYFNLYTPMFKEKFPYSTTALVFLTDAWHLLKALVLICFLFAIVYYKPIVGFWGDIWILFIAYSISFNLFEGKIFQRSYWKSRK